MEVGVMGPVSMVTQPASQGTVAAGTPLFVPV